jgi:hypothetical protein
MKILDAAKNIKFYLEISNSGEELVLNYLKKS